MNESLLQVRNVTAGYGQMEVLRELSMDAGRQQITALLGPNGAGKTTLVNTIMGILPNVTGEIFFDGANILGKKASQLVPRGLALVPEGRCVFPEMSVRDNLLVGGHTIRERRELREGLTRAYQFFPQLSDWRDRDAGTLSGGEQQMLAIARALVAGPTLLILDEPSLGLAPRIIEHVAEKIKELRDAGLTVLLAEQNASLAFHVSDYGYVLSGGMVIAFGGTADLKENPEVQATYLGRTK